VASVKCPKCGKKVSIDGVGDANSAMCFSCGASILVPNSAPDVVDSFASHRTFERTTTRKTPKPIAKPKTPVPILDLEVLDPYTGPEIAEPVAEPRIPEAVPRPVDFETLPKLSDPHSAVWQKNAEPEAKPLIPDPMDGLVDFESLPKLKDTESRIRGGSCESEGKGRSAMPPPFPRARKSSIGIPPPLVSGTPIYRVALLSLALGAGSFFVCLGPILSLPGLLVGIVAFSRIPVSGGTPRDAGLAKAGIIVNGMNLLFSALLAMVA
jgi:hypothetical protein